MNQIKNQFGQVIKILRSDNAKEYFSSTFSNILSSHGILHQSTCPHTPQQNGITKRKNKYLVEIARTILLRANVPVHHWGDAILIVGFLINRMPSSSLNHKVPFLILFPYNPLFHSSPRVFGCVCFVHDMSPRLDKLSARSLKCVFLGYSRLQKGIDVTLLKPRNITCLSMLHSLNRPLTSLHLFKMFMSYNRSSLFPWLSTIFPMSLSIQVSIKVLLSHHLHILILSNTGPRLIVQFSRNMVNPLLQILLPHLLIPRLLVKVIHVAPLLSEKVLFPLEIHIPFIIFLAITDYRLPFYHFYPQFLLLLFPKM